MSMELITIIATIISANIALAGLIIRLIITGQNSLRSEMREQREEMQAHRKETQAHRAENQAEFKAVRAEMQAESKAVRAEMQAEFKTTRKETQAESKTTLQAIGELRERMAHLEGLMEGLREALTGRRVAEDPGQYGTN